MNTTEIAKMLGISRGTVSRVINNQPNVKKETREKILAALEQYGYTPNETARSLVMNKSFRIAVIVFSEPVFFWNQVESGAHLAHDELKSLGVCVEYFSTDIMHPEEQLELLKRLPEEGYDGIIIAPNDPQLLLDEIDKLACQNYPVVIINVELPSAVHLCYIGCDYIQAGMLAGEVMAKLIGREGKIGILALKDPVMSIEQRITGFRREISKYPNITVEQVARFPRITQGVYEEVLSLLKPAAHIKGIYVSFAGLEQAARAIKELHLEGEVCLIGYDLNQDIYNLLQEGAVTATICHEPFQQGYSAVKILYRYLSHGILPGSTFKYTKLEAVFAHNAQYYMNPDEVGLC